jgi:hypothetical protein
MATLPIYLEVEDVAVGPVLLALRKMRGIIKMNLDLGLEAPALPGRQRQQGMRLRACAVRQRPRSLASSEGA